MIKYFCDICGEEALRQKFIIPKYSSEEYCILGDSFHSVRRLVCFEEVHLCNHHCEEIANMWELKEENK